MASTAFAQEQVGVRVQPTLLEERVEAGQVFSSVLYITNTGSKAETFFLSVKNISRILPDGTPEFVQEVQEASGLEISSWVTLERQSATIAPGKTENIPFSIKVPANASPGGHFGGIVVVTQPTDSGNNVSVVAYGASMIIALRVAGEATEDATIREFRTDKMIYGTPKVTFIARVQNNGTTLIRPRGPIEVVDMWGKKVGTIIMNEEAAGILPNAEREFQATWKGEGLVFGRYAVVMSLSYGDDKKSTITEYTSFWVWPTKIIVPVSLGIIGAFLLLGFLVRMHVRRKVLEMKSLAKERGVNLESPDQSSTSGSRLFSRTISVMIGAVFLLILLFFLFA